MKVLENLKKVDPIFVLSALFVGRVIFFSAGIGDAIALFPLCGLTGYKYYLKSKEQEPIEARVMAEIKSLRDAVSSIKAATGLRSKAADATPTRFF